jgi:hypothetical protein
MLRLPSQQVFKALRNHLPRPICNPLRNLCNPLQTRHIHGLEAPYEGPASYATITRRFASHPNPLVFFTEKKAKEAVERGEFVDIHDIGRTDPKDYDVLITDMSERILRDSISKLVGIPYLKKATRDEARQNLETSTGFFYGRNSRIIFPCVVGFEERAHWVFFILDPISPLTYLSAHISVPTNR